KARLMGILSDSTGQTQEVIERDTDRNFYMDAQQAVDYGLVDQVLAPPKPEEKK
ncbi:MAG: ATP-dependent Clp protease proteolytic subunit, partial [Chloroflexi bacterium HGW-Chloroflexi-7]